MVLMENSPAIQVVAKSNNVVIVRNTNTIAFNISIELDLECYGELNNIRINYIVAESWEWMLFLDLMANVDLLMVLNVRIVRKYRINLLIKPVLK